MNRESLIRHLARAEAPSHEQTSPPVKMIAELDHRRQHGYSELLVIFEGNASCTSRTVIESLLNSQAFD